MYHGTKTGVIYNFSWVVCCANWQWVFIWHLLQLYVHKVFALCNQLVRGFYDCISAILVTLFGILCKKIKEFNKAKLISNFLTEESCLLPSSHILFLPLESKIPIFGLYTDFLHNCLKKGFFDIIIAQRSTSQPRYLHYSWSWPDCFICFGFLCLHHSLLHEATDLIIDWILVLGCRCRYVGRLSSNCSALTG